MRLRLIRPSLGVMAAMALTIGLASAAYADGAAGVGADTTGGVQSLLSAADNDLATALNDVLAADPVALTFAQNELSATNDPATTGEVPACAVGVGFTTGHFTISASGNTVLVCHGQFPVSPPQAVVTKGLLCGVPDPTGGVVFTDNSHLVVTPSGQVILVCHINPSS